MGARATRNWLTTQKQFRLRAAQHFTRVTRPTPSQVASAHCSPTAGKAQKPAESAGLAAVARHAATLGPRPNCSRSGTGRREKHAPSGRKAQHKAAAPTRSSDQRYLVGSGDWNHGAARALSADCSNWSVDHEQQTGWSVRVSCTCFLSLSAKQTSVSAGSLPTAFSISIELRVTTSVWKDETRYACQLKCFTFDQVFIK